MLDLARHIVNQKSGSFEPEKFEDHYETALIELINQKRTGKPIRPKERPQGENVVDLMEALRRSVGGAAAETSAPKKSAKKPIAGKKQAKEASTKKPASRSRRKSA
jgi:DNA end-binding protein Ku